MLLSGKGGEARTSRTGPTGKVTIAGRNERSREGHKACQYDPKDGKENEDGKHDHAATVPVALLLLQVNMHHDHYQGDARDGHGVDALAKDDGRTVADVVNKGDDDNDGGREEAH